MTTGKWDNAQVAGNALRIYANRTMHDGCNMAFDIDTTGIGLVATDANAGGDEVASIGIGLEAHKVGA